MKTNPSLILLAMCLSIATFAQKTTAPILKTIVVTYDSAIAYSEIGWVYFTAEKDKKIMQFQPPDVNGNRNLVNQFWQLTPSKSQDGVENHTASGHKGTKYELTYTSKKIEGEGGMMDVNVIKEYEVYDSIYIKFKNMYQSWQTENSKYEAKNKISNPGSIAKKYIELGKEGNLKGMKQLIISKEKSEELKDNHSIYRQIDEMDKIASQNTPEGTKNEIAKLFLKEFSSDKQKVLQNPVTYYLDENNVCVAIASSAKRLYYINLIKLNGQWKISRADDKPGIQGGTAHTKFDVERIMQKRTKELNPA